MLNTLRKQRDNIIIKIVLWVIVLSFALYFGTSEMLKSSDVTSSSIAKVNGAEISASKYNYQVESQSEKLREMVKDPKMQEQILQSIRVQTLQSLINQELLNQQLSKYGLKATHVELAEHVKTSPEFQNNGKFDVAYYTNRFLPGYNQMTNSSYELDTLKELSMQRFFSVFSSPLQLTEKELSTLDVIQNTTFKYAVIRIPIKAATNSDTNPGTTDNDANSKVKADEVWSALKQGKNTEKLLADLKLTKTETATLTYNKLKTVFGGKGSLENLKQLATLTPDKPLPENIITEGNYYYLVKLLERKTPDTDKKNEALSGLDTSYAESLASNLESAFIRELRTNANIKISDALTQSLSAKALQ